MDSPDTPISENELNAFLSGADPLAQQLQQLAQEPSAALTAAIMQRVALQQTQTLNQNSHLKTQQPSSVAEQIQRQPAANDAGNLNLVPQTKLTQWLRRWQTPLTLAASIMVAVLLTRQWQGWHPDAAQPTVAQNSGGRAKPTNFAEKDREKNSPNEPSQQNPANLIAQADAPLDASTENVRLRDVDSALLGIPKAQKNAPPENSPLKPDVWLANIEQLIKQNQLQKAQTEYQRFHKQYADFVIPEPIQNRFTHAGLKLQDNTLK